jgi:hypothetical protein
MPSLTASIYEMMQHSMDMKSRRAGVSEEDIALSYQMGMHPIDVRVFRDWSSRGYLFVIRLPKIMARPFQGIMTPKEMDVKKKTEQYGVVITAEREDGEGNKYMAETAIFVSDYDLMSVWKSFGNSYQKIFISAANGASRGSYPPEGTALISALNKELQSILQHGCQDDYQSSGNPNVKAEDRFGAFAKGKVIVCESRAACAATYKQYDLDWPYDELGKYSGEMLDKK